QYYYNFFLSGYNTSRKGWIAFSKCGKKCHLMKKSVIIKSGAEILKNIRDLIINHYGELTESDRFVAKTILNDPDASHLNTIDDLAAFCSVSKSTIIRFTKKAWSGRFCGIKGFIEVKSKIISRN